MVCRLKILLQYIQKAVFCFHYSTVTQLQTAATHFKFSSKQTGQQQYHKTELLFCTSGAQQWYLKADLSHTCSALLKYFKKL